MISLEHVNHGAVAQRIKYQKSLLDLEKNGNFTGSSSCGRKEVNILKQFLSIRFHYIRGAGKI